MEKTGCSHSLSRKLVKSHIYRAEPELFSPIAMNGYSIEGRALTAYRDLNSTHTAKDTERMIETSCYPVPFQELHIWTGTIQCTFASFDRIQKRLRGFVGD